MHSKKIRIGFALLTLLLIAHSPISLGNTYYIDSENGNDNSNGSAATSSGAFGPWRTLARLKAAPLLPGDTVLLRCGRRWSETLELNQSGAATAPIKVSSYPTACNDKPSIDGSIKVPISAWQSGTPNGVYVATYPFTLISNGTFSTGTSGWTMWSESKIATLTAETISCRAGSAPCLQLNGGSNTGHGLISSPAFSLEESRDYTVSLNANIPSGKWVRFTLRRNAAPWEIIAQTSTTGSGAWSEVTFKTNSKMSVDNARLDIEFSGSIIAQWDDVKVIPIIAPPKALYSNGKWQNIAHYPNKGSIPARPNSQYFLTAEASDRVLRADGTSYGSTYVVLDPLNNGLTSAGVAGDARIYVRTTPWQLEEFSVTRIDGNRAYLDRTSSYPIEKSFGFFFTGAPWMLDREEEWLFNSAAKTLIYRPLNSSAPDKVTVSELSLGANLNGRAYITLDNLRFENIEVGINAMNTVGIQVVNSAIENTSREGILISGARSIEIRSNDLRNTGRDAISGYRTTPLETNYAAISDNTIIGSGLHLHNDQVVSIPTPNRAAVYSATNSTVKRNRIEKTAYNGIYPGPNSNVSENTIKNACTFLDDCAGVYLFGSNHNSTIERNHIEDLIGTIDGITRTRPHVVGVYLDELSSGVTVKRNTVINAAYGIQLHNAFKNFILENTLFGNRIFQIWLQEGSRIVDSAGDLHSNEITGNKIFSTSGSYGVAHDTAFSTTARFASYDYNLHSGLINQYVAREGSSTKETAYTFAAWQAITVRQSDPNGTEVKPTGYASFAVRNYNIFAPSTDSANEWASWSAAQPKPVVRTDEYAQETGISLQANTAPSLLSSPNFSVKKGSWYRVSFDVASSQNIRFEVAGRRGGGGSNGYEFLSENSTRVFSDPSWKKFSFIFKSNETVNKDDPVTLDNGARIDFQNVPPSVKLFIRDLEVVEVAPVGTSLITSILSNDSNEPRSFDCPEEGVSTNACGFFVNFDGSENISWPHTVGALDAVIVYTKDTSLQDIDGDGIADVQDSCPNSPVGEFVNGRGCGRSQ